MSRFIVPLAAVFFPILSALAPLTPGKANIVHLNAPWLQGFVARQPVQAEQSTLLCADWLGAPFWKTATSRDVRRCAAAGYGSVRHTYEAGHTILHVAAITTHRPEVIRTILRIGGDPDVRDRKGRTSLHVAAAGNAPANIIAILAAASEEPDTRTPDGFTALHIAAAANPDPNVIRALATAGADPNVVTDQAVTALHLAATSNPALEVVIALLDVRADACARTPRAKTAFDLVRQKQSAWRRLNHGPDLQRQLDHFMYLADTLRCRKNP